MIEHEKYVAARSTDLAFQIKSKAHQRALPVEVEAECYLDAALVVLHDELSRRGDLDQIVPFLQHRIARVLKTGERP